MPKLYLEKSFKVIQLSEGVSTLGLFQIFLVNSMWFAYFVIQCEHAKELRPLKRSLEAYRTETVSRGGFSSFEFRGPVLFKAM